MIKIPTNCECLARLAIPDKIPKCPLTQLFYSYSDYLTLKTKTLLRGQGIAECVVIGCESTRFLIFKCVRKLGKMVFGARLSFPYFWIDPGAGVNLSNYIYILSNLSH